MKQLSVNKSKRLWLIIYQIILLDDLAILEKAAEIHANLRLRGLPIQTEDILIAATAIVKGLTVVSNDRDLLRVEGLSLDNWVEG